LTVVKSPLRYPGGKYRAIKLITSLIPAGLTELVSPFFGGGSIELNCAANGIQVYGYDSFKPLVAFWKLLQRNPQWLAEQVKSHHPLSQAEFYRLQNLHRDEETEEQAVLFYVLNRASFSGTTMSGGCSQESVQGRFTQSSIDRLLTFGVKNFNVDYADFHATLERHPQAFLYLDPPYMIKSSLYGTRGSTHRGFDHEGLAEKLRQRSGWILSYNNCEQVREFYKDFKITFPDWKYGMSSDKTSKEVLILNL
jgi:DNA adenine methylase